MKKSIFHFTTIICVIFISSCSGLEVKRGVKDNMFYSSAYPKINIKIDPSLRYTGCKDLIRTTKVKGLIPYNIDIKSKSYAFEGNGKFFYMDHLQFS